MKRILHFMGSALILVTLLQPITNIPESPAVMAESVTHQISAQDTKITEIKKVDIQPAEEANITPPVVTNPSDNKTIVWNYLRQHFSPNQTAGIMGNLQQEHNFRTDGDGLAQWLDGRKERLYAKPDPTSIHTQVAFLVEELKSTESRAYNAIMASDGLENATVAFQDLFERCHPMYCHLNQRIGYAQAILQEYNR